MTERMVQVPVSLLQELAECVGDGSRAVAVQPALKAARAVAALLSQPTPSAGPEDMAPGTTFWARTRDGVLSTLDRFWMVADNGWVFSTEAHHLNADRLDPSTIRDVTPPPTAEDADRG